MVKVGVIGIGKMGLAILRGLAEVVPPEDLSACDVSPERQELAKGMGIRVLGGARGVAEEAELVVLAVKPKEVRGVLEEIREAVDPSKVVLSIAAGIRTSLIDELLGQRGRILRMMPNLPLSIGEGAMALSKGPRAEEGDVKAIRDLFSRLGEVIEVPEELMDAVTALSGSGPAFVALFLEAMAEAGVRLGLKREDALRLAAKTALGTARMILEGTDPAALKQEVTSPGGTTAEGLYVLEREGLKGVVMEAIARAAARAKELSGG